MGQFAEWLSESSRGEIMRNAIARMKLMMTLKKVGEEQGDLSMYDYLREKYTDLSALQDVDWFAACDWLEDRGVDASDMRRAAIR